MQDYFFKDDSNTSKTTAAASDLARSGKTAAVIHIPNESPWATSLGN